MLQQSPWHKHESLGMDQRKGGAEKVKAKKRSKSDNSNEDQGSKLSRIMFWKSKSSTTSQDSSTKKTKQSITKERIGLFSRSKKVEPPKDGWPTFWNSKAQDETRQSRNPFTTFSSPSSSALASSSQTALSTQVQQPPHQHEHSHRSLQRQSQTPGMSMSNYTFLAIHDIFGIGKALEMILELFLAHGNFLRQQPFWLQCMILCWDGTVILMALWCLTRAIGIAEVLVYGLDDMLRAVASVGHGVRHLVSFIGRVF